MDIYRMRKGFYETELAYDMYRKAITAGSALPQASSFEEFEKLLFLKEEDRYSIPLITKGGLGFAVGVVDREKGEGFVSMVVVHPKYRQKGVASCLLDEMEKQMENAGVTALAIDLA